jgi:hypothetical protein
MTDKCTILIYFSIYNNDLHAFVKTLLIISLSSANFFHIYDHVPILLAHPTYRLILLTGLSDPWFPPYRSVKRGFTVPICRVSLRIIITLHSPSLNKCFLAWHNLYDCSVGLYLSSKGASRLLVLRVVLMQSLGDSCRCVQTATLPTL